MNRVKYLDGKYMSWEETMEDFHESLKVKKAEEAYKQHLSNLQNGFPDKQKLPPPPPSPQEQTQMQLNNIPAQSANSYPSPPQYSYSYNQYNPQENNFNFNQQPENYNFNPPADNFASFKPTGFNDNFGFNNANNFGFKQADNFGFNSDSFNFKPSENFGFNAKDSFSSFNNQFNSFNQFNSSFNNPFNQNSSFGSSVSFTPKASFNYSSPRFPMQFNRLENDIIFEENQNNAAIRY